jgi:hypothetical protein
VALKKQVGFEAIFTVVLLWSEFEKAESFWAEKNWAE